MFQERGKVAGNRYSAVSKATALALVWAAGCVSAPRAAQAAGGDEGVKPLAPFVEPDTLDSKVPTPASVIGHVMGDGAVRYDEWVRYLKVLADASPLVTLTPYAESHEGRTLYFATITNEANHARLDRIRADNAKLADPRKLGSPGEATTIIETLPGIAWMAYNIHGDELSSTEAAVQLAYQLAAGTDEATQRLRDELVIHIDPSMNPDGRERYLNQLQSLTGKIPNSDYQAMQHSGLWSAGRGNHYLFDLNRDWLPQVHPETRGRAAKMLEWNPHLVVDSHEMGSLDTYLFDPPREPINGNQSAKTLEWRRRFSQDQAEAFDRHGWSYYTREWYEEWYPGYTNAWAGLQGSIGILYEQAGVNAASIKQPAGNVLTYRDAVHHQLVSSLANLESLRANRKQIMADFTADREWAVAPERSGTETLLVTPPTDPALLGRFADLLTRHGIEVGVAAAAFETKGATDLWGNRVDSKLLPPGTLVVRAAQPRRRLLLALLEFDPHMTDAFLADERKDLENHRGTRIYDITAWNVCMAYGLDAYWAEVASPVPLNGLPKNAAEPLTARPAYGFLADGASGDNYRLAARLLEKDVKVRVATEAFTIGGHAYQPGTLLIRNGENVADVVDALSEASADLEVTVRPAETARSQQGPDLGGQRFGLLTQPRIAIASQWPVSSTSFGAIWHLLDARIGLRVSPINLQSISGIDLRAYNVLVLPDTWGAGALGAILNEGVRASLKAWLEAGGTLVAVGDAAAFLAAEERGLSSVRLRHDVLEELPVFAETVKKERSARDVKINPGEVWGTSEPASSGTNGEDDDATEKGRNEAADEENKAKHKEGSGSAGDAKAREREDEWRRVFSPLGVIARASLDPEHWLTFGLPAYPHTADELPVLISGSSVLMAKYPVATPVRLADEPKVRLAGLMWPEARKRWANSAYATVERVGNGQIILFVTNPIFRGYFEGTGRLLLNALLFGPGLGASQAVPW